MKENNDGTDTNVGSMENSIEEAIKIMEHWVEYEKNNKEKINRADELINIQETILLNYKRALKENEELKEYIAIAPNLDEMTAIKYRNIQQDAYIRGRAEEQKKAGQIIYENYIPIQKIKDKIEEYKNMLKTCNKVKDIDRIKAINERILELEELLEGRE